MFKSDKVIMKFYFNSFPKRNNRDLILPLYLHFKKIKKLKKKKRKKILKIIKYLFSKSYYKL